MPTATAAVTVTVAPAETTATAVPPTQEENAAANPVQSTSTAAAGAADSATGCTDLAAFDQDITVPDNTHFRQGESFVKTWRVYNAGTCTWDSGYAMVLVNGDLMGATSPSPLPDSVAPGESVDLSLDLTTPERGGLAYANWKFFNAASQVFGTGLNGNGTIWVQILVNWIAPGESLAVPVPHVGACDYSENPAFVETLLGLINNARTASGSEPLSLNPLLSAAAEAHSSDMACNDFVDHRGSDGSTWYDRITAQGYTYTRATENIYVGHPEYGGTPQGAFDWWMSSQVHHDNILDPQVTEIGIGYAYYPASTYRGYYTLVFAAP